MTNRVFSFGCRLNRAEGEQIATLLQAPGLQAPVEASSLQHETLVVNSCAVTLEAERQVRQKVRRLHRERPHARIVVAGCAAHLNGESYRKMKGVEKVLGNDTKLLASSYAFATETMLPRADRERRTPLLAFDTKSAQPFQRTRFVLPVQQGCNHRCTFCMIPLARGGARSLDIDLACRSVELAVARGVKEVVLSGIDLASWGEDLPQRPPLGVLVEAVLRRSPRLERLRLSSIDGAALDPLLQRLFGEEERLMPYLHLSLQSGDNMILKRMRRRHSREQAVALCRSLRARRPDLALGADLIAGFPTESEAMFDNTLSLIADAGLHLLHIFPFSPRQGTPAARMPQVERGIVRERARRLRVKAAEAHKAFLQELYATSDRFLVEGGDENKEGGEDIVGRSRHNMRTRLLPPCNKVAGKIARLSTRAKLRENSAKENFDRKNFDTGSLVKGSLVRARILSAAEQPCAHTLTARMEETPCSL